MKYLPYLVLLVVFAGMIMFTQRNKRRQQAAELVRAAKIDAGTEVMTTSGLYGTVTRRNDDGTVLIEIAPGVEVRFALAAVRDAASLTAPYRRGFAGRPDSADSDSSDSSDSPLEPPELDAADGTSGARGTDGSDVAGGSVRMRKPSSASAKRRGPAIRPEPGDTGPLP